MYVVDILGVPEMDENELLDELSQHGYIESLRLVEGKAVVTVSDKDVSESILSDYSDRYLRGVPVTATLRKSCIRKSCNCKNGCK